MMLKFQTLGLVSDGKVNTLGALYRSKVNISNSFQKNRKKQKIVTEKREFLRKTSFCKIDFFKRL